MEESVFLKHGCAGSRPVILCMIQLLCFFLNSFAAKPQICAPRLWPIKCIVPQSDATVVAFVICSKNLYRQEYYSTNYYKCRK